MKFVSLLWWEGINCACVNLSVVLRVLGVFAEVHWEAGRRFPRHTPHLQQVGNQRLLIKPSSPRYPPLSVWNGTWLQSECQFTSTPTSSVSSSSHPHLSHLLLRALQESQPPTMSYDTSTSTLPDGDPLHHLLLNLCEINKLPSDLLSASLSTFVSTLYKSSVTLIHRMNVLKAPPLYLSPLPLNGTFSQKMTILSASAHPHAEGMSGGVFFFWSFTAKQPCSIQLNNWNRRGMYENNWEKKKKWLQADPSSSV